MGWAPKGGLKAQQDCEIRFRFDQERRVRDARCSMSPSAARWAVATLVACERGTWSLGPGQYRSVVIQQKTGNPVSFEITETTRESLIRYLDPRGRVASDFLFPSRIDRADHLTPSASARGGRYGRFADDARVGVVRWQRLSSVRRSGAGEQRVACVLAYDGGPPSSAASASNRSATSMTEALASPRRMHT